MISQNMAGKKALIVSNGSRGDCQPYMALALGMKNAGFDALIFTITLYGTNKKLGPLYALP